MSDSHVVNKCYKPRLEQEKVNLSKYAGDKWATMTVEQRTTVCTLNGLYCGRHILSNMATTAIEGMKAFEKENGCERPQSGFTTGNSVAYDLI